MNLCTNGVIFSLYILLLIKSKKGKKLEKDKTLKMIEKNLKYTIIIELAKA